MAVSKSLMDLVKSSKNKYSTGNSKTFKFPEGKTKVRLLTANEGEKFWRDLGVHWIKPDLNAKPVAVTGCQGITHDEECPICTAIATASASAPDDESKKIIDSWKARGQVLVNALIRVKGKADELQILDMTAATFGKFMDVMEEYLEEGIQVMSLSEGIDFVVERKGKGLDTEYLVMPAAKSSPVDPEILEKLNDLDAFIEKNYFRTGDDVKALASITSITGVSTAAISSATKGKALLTSEESSVDDAEVSDDEDDDMETAEAPKSTKKKPAPKPKAKAKAEVVEADELDEDDLDSVLSELDDIT